jgi:signal peptidase
MKIKKVLNIGYYFVLAILVFLIILFIGSVLPIPGNYKLLTVVSGSMEPTIHTGSVIVVKPSENYKIGDIITFKLSPSEKTPTTHRIAEMEVQAGIPIYTTKGDANDSPDTSKIYQRQIVGKMIAKIPFLGYAMDFVRKPVGFALVIITPAVLIILDEIRKIWKEIIKKKNKTKESAIDKLKNE